MLPSSSYPQSSGSTNIGQGIPLNNSAVLISSFRLLLKSSVATTRYSYFFLLVLRLSTVNQPVDSITAVSPHLPSDILVFVDQAFHLILRSPNFSLAIFNFCCVPVTSWKYTRSIYPIIVGCSRLYQRNLHSDSSAPPMAVIMGTIRSALRSKVNTLSNTILSSIVAIANGSSSLICSAIGLKNLPACPFFNFAKVISICSIK